MKNVLYALIIIAASFFLISCSQAYRAYDKRISVSVTPKEIFDIDTELRFFVNMSKSENDRLKRELAVRGLQVFAGYTRGMLNGTVIADKQFITDILKFAEEYKKYSGKRQKEVYDEVIKTLQELLKYLNEREKAG